MLMDQVIEQMKLDIADGDWTAIVELLNNIPSEVLETYLPENND